jgi:hypothetical protein
MPKTDIELNVLANQIKNETVEGANTETRIGTMLLELIASKLNIDGLKTINNQSLLGAGNLNIDDAAAYTHKSDTAAGNTVNNATQITKTLTVINTSIAGGGVKLPTANGSPQITNGTTHYVVNMTANKVILYAPGGYVHVKGANETTFVLHPYTTHKFVFNSYLYWLANLEDLKLDGIRLTDVGGTDITGAEPLKVGRNLVRSTNLNGGSFCCKFPATAQEGDIVVVDLQGQNPNPIRLLTPNGNIVVGSDTYLSFLDLPSHSHAYSFQLVENSWSLILDKLRTIRLPEMSVTTANTSGVNFQSNGVNSNVGSFSTGSGGSDILLLNPENIWNILPGKGIMTNMRVTSNILTADSNGQTVQVNLTFAGIAKNGSAYSGNAGTVYLGTSRVTSVGLQHSPNASVMDKGTMYGSNSVGLMVGLNLKNPGGVVQDGDSITYYTIAVVIPNGYPAKQYKFQVELDYYQF